jgi:alpha-1,2-mannosyltransferase
MFSQEWNQRIAAGIAVVVLLVLGAQFQHFLQQYKDESTEAASADASDPHPSSPRKEFSGDFRIYYTASLVARRPGDHRLYYVPEDSRLLWIENIPQDTPWAKIARSAGISNTMHFIAPPFAALLFEPLSVFKWQTSLLIWKLVLLGMMLVSIYLCLLLTGREQLWLKFGFATAAAFSFFPLMETLGEGQIDPVTLLCWVGGIYFIKTERPFWSALLFAVGTLVKVSPAIVIALFLLRRQWKWLFGYGASLAGLLALSIWRLGWENHVVFAKQIFPALSCGIATLGNKSLAGFIDDLYLGRVPLEAATVPAWVCLLTKIMGLLLFAAVLFYFWRRNKTSSGLVHELVTVSLVFLLISPVSWRHHYLLALVPLLYLWNVAAQSRFRIAVLAFATLAIGTVFPDYVIASVRNPALDIAFASMVPVSSLLLLWVLCTRGSNHPLADSAIA